MREERGQATVEWVGLVLLAALALGGLAALTARGREDDSLGHALAGRLSCAARGGCAAVGAPRGTRVRVVGGRTGRALRTPRVRLPGGPRSSAWRPGSARRLSRARAA